MTRLTHWEAQERASATKLGTYDVELDLTTGDTVFRSTTVVTFSATTPGGSTFLELRPATLHSVVLNGRPLDPAALADGRIRLTGLRAQNTVTVVADMAYSQDGQGIHRTVDAADGETYVWAHCAVDAAPRVFACFDQPDLKAPLILRVTAPAHWRVLGTGHAERLDEHRWRFAPTPPQPTYLMTLAAGPYVSHHAEHDGIPLGVHARASLADALEREHPEILEITAQCLDEYHRLFGVRYPYSRYDQVFVPEFGNLAMENPGCVLIRDQFVFESEPTGADREDRAVVIAHEMAHMWFGNLVTMRWWNDLWLNESFADYMGHRVASDATRFTGARMSFAVGRKGQGYAADQRPTTHPVAGTAADIDEAELAFDRISYFKGSAVLRQLAARLGDEVLFAGLRRYFERHAWSNATTEDFLAALGEAAGAGLTEWAEQWLATADVNTLTPVVRTENGRIASAEILQSAPAAHPVLRDHTLDIGLYGPEGRTVVRAEVRGARTPLPALTGLPAPGLLLLNDGDLAYAKVRYDASATPALAAGLPGLNPLNRAMVWGSLLLSVQDGSYPAADYLTLAVAALATERELPILTEVLRQARTEIADRYLAPEARDQALAALCAGLSGLLSDPATAPGLGLPALRALVDCTADPELLHGWLAPGAVLPAGVPLDADLAWRIRYRLAVLGGLDADDLAAAEAAAPGGQSAQWAAKCRAALPDPVAKKAAWEAVTGDRTLSHHTVWSLAEGFWQPEQAARTAEYADRFFSDVPAALEGREGLTVLLVRYLYPRYAAGPGTLRAADRALARTDLGPLLRRNLTDLTDDLRRLTAARGLETR
ncbi:Aminopeptidase N [Streptomyces sp. RB17]|uniref:aminopeptidase N n=1 Tax=Streptomyces sp. RB17 TaxID=2585197 RepID=UPI001295D53E|nr:aminopeptidase N [Streptomyces sp. RB17]MQY35026.1 Aminopeptidase N [Streptomyces sp. RB17]